MAEIKNAVETIQAVIETIWATFFAWMPLPLIVVFGGMVAVSAVILGIKIAALIKSAIPFL